MTEFYKHPQMADGHLNKCKPCTRADVLANRLARRQYYLDYDRIREQTEARKETRRRSYLRYRRLRPDQYRATRAVGNAMRDGRLTKKPCEVCGGTSNIQAHHEDYSKPLEVRWLCVQHHHQLHRERRP